MVNRFGDLFLVVPDGSVHWLDIGTGELKQLASSRDEFGRRIDENDNANDWLMIPLVDRLVEAGMTLEFGQCYSYRMLPVVGGDYVPENVVIKTLHSHYSALGALHEKVKDLPDGTKVEVEVEGPN